MVGIEFRLLGRIEAVHAGGPLDLGHPRQRYVLAALLVDANRPVDADELLDRVWADHPPRNARNALSGYLTRLRAVLAIDSGITLDRRNGGYQLTMDPAATDLHRFTDLLARAAKQLTAESDDAAIHLLDEALALWRDGALGDLDTPWANARRSVLEDARHAAELDRTDLALARGQHDRVLAGLAARSATRPLDERLAGQLMQALYRCGRPAEALRRYQAVRKDLADELGTDPGPELQQLHHRILTADPELTWSGRRDRRAAAAVPRQLPAAPQTFTGRTAELARLDRAADHADPPAAGMVVTVVSGTAGVGKTALALQWAHGAADRFPEGQLHVNLRGFDADATALAPADALRGFLVALGVSPRAIPTAQDERAALYRSLLAGRRVLVVLDDARDADQVGPLLPGAAGCVVVVTSRHQLSALVASHGARHVALGLLSPAASYDLLLRRIGPDRMSAEPEAAREIVERCAGLPLALAIVGARAATRPTFQLTALADELRRADRDRSLEPFDSGSLELTSVLSASYRALPAETARIFRLLGLHPGPDVTPALAASLAGCDMQRARRSLATLAEVNLVAEHVPGRFALHNLLRAFAAEQTRHHDAGNERDSAVRRGLDHLLGTAFGGAMLLAPDRDPIRLPDAETILRPERFEDVAAAIAWFTAEHAHLLAAVEQAADAGLDTHAWQLAWSIATYLDRQGHWYAWAATQRTALAAARRLGDRSAEADAHRTLGHACRRLGQVAEADEHFHRALDLFGALGDREGEARTHFCISFLLESQGRPADSCVHDRRALVLFETIDHGIGQAIALNNLGWHDVLRGEPAAALVHCRRALALFGALGNRHGEASTWDTVGYANYHLGAHADATAAYQRALDLYRREGDRYGEADTLAHLGDTEQAAGRPDAALRSWRAALAILDDLDQPEIPALRSRLDRAIGAASPSPG